MKFKKWLKYIDTAGLMCNIYITYQKKGKVEGTYETDSDLIYAGSMYDIPYWLVDYEIDKSDADGEPIYYATNLKANENDEIGTKDLKGFIIFLKEKN